MFFIIILVFILKITAAADNLAALNASMQAVEVQEVNQKTVNHLYFTKFAKGEQPTRGNDIVLLEYIAAQCPYIGGNAVFEARGLLALMNKEGVYDDVNTCLEQGISLRKKPAKNTVTSTATFVKVSPNPAVSTARFSVSENLLNSTYNIIDATGKVVLSNTLTNTNQDVDITNVSSGVYYIKIIGTTYEVEPIKLVIIK